ncbi:flagellar motor protein MotB [Treponema sp.]|uniref:flagellar motor protein MotB n=1 Tax=Treponema sp. TaxID=166 RepID=UPI00298E2C7D|nr:flagellar motor protein MotB [Treponema sp.]
MAKKEKKEPEKPSTAWQGTYGDMITLMLCFFVMLYNPSEVDIQELATITESLQMNQTDTPKGGMSLSSGRLSDLGNTISALPSLEKGKNLGTAMKKAVSLFAPEIHSNKITVTSDERGVVITLAADYFFKKGSAELNIDETRDALLHLSEFFNDPELKDRRFRIEGHTDNTPVSQERYDVEEDESLEPAENNEENYTNKRDSQKFNSNWELSSQRAINVLYYLADFGVDEQKFCVAGYADTRPKFDNNTPEGQAYNRRVDIIILDEAHF